MRQALLLGGCAVVAGLGSLIAGSSVAVASPAVEDCPEGTFAVNFGQECAGGPSAWTPPPPYDPGNLSGSPGSPFLFVAGMPCNSARWSNCMAWIQNPSP